MPMPGYRGLILSRFSPFRDPLIGMFPRTAESLRNDESILANSQLLLVNC